MNGIRFGHLKKCILARTANFFEAFVRRESAMDVPLDNGLTFGFLQVNFQLISFHMDSVYTHFGD